MEFAHKIKKKTIFYFLANITLIKKILIYV